MQEYFLYLVYVCLPWIYKLDTQEITTGLEGLWILEGLSSGGGWKGLSSTYP